MTAADDRHAGFSDAVVGLVGRAADWQAIPTDGAVRAAVLIAGLVNEPHARP